MPRLTVIMPAYNAAETIAQAVRSTLIDLPRDSLLHVVDDASTDNTLDTLLQIAELDQRISVQANPVNQGVARTLNRLLMGCDSQYVARMDADDIVIPGRFRRATAVLASGKADVLFGGLVHLGPGRRVRPAAQLPISPAAFGSFVLLQNPVIHSTMVGHTSVLVDAGGYRVVPSEDYDLWIRLVSAGRRLRRIGQPAVFYRHHPQQITNSSRWREAAKDNPLSAEAHADLSELVLGVRHEVYSILRSKSLSRNQFKALASFLHDLKANVDGLTPIERADLSRLCLKVAGGRRTIEESHVA
jgi:glycosyltransferase involved in cell wall biosynthesis